MTGQFKKILIIKPSALGDIIQALPAACCLAKSFPDAQIDWFIRPEYAALIENHPCIHSIVIFDRRKLGKWWFKPDSFTELVKLVRHLRKEKYDIVFDFQGRFRSAIFAWFSGCKQRIGMAQTQEITGIFYTQKIKQSASSVHLVDYFLDMVCTAGAKRSKAEFGLKPDKQNTDEIRNILKSNNANPNNYAVFTPAATVEAKRWPIENFAALAEKVRKKYQCSIVGIGVESEKMIVRELETLADVPVINLAGKTNIQQLIAALAGARVVVSNDTGPAHIAAALGVPMVLIFGLTNPSRVGPYRRPQTIAAIDADRREKEIESTNPVHNIKNVTVESVFEVIIRQLN
ncbi:MAG: glycosyltransferase family 9 protein [Phycisphaerae bacterium]|nr:glycosyltransferase family 9 protein [Phycisphaerae bacterium]